MKGTAKNPSYKIRQTIPNSKSVSIIGTYYRTKRRLGKVRYLGGRRFLV